MQIFPKKHKEYSAIVENIKSYDNNFSYIMLINLMIFINCVIF